MTGKAETSKVAAERLRQGGGAIFPGGSFGCLSAEPRTRSSAMPEEKDAPERPSAPKAGTPPD